MILKWNYFIHQGLRENMEDFILIDKFIINNKKNYLFCVIDGHGGSDSARYFKSIFKEKLYESLENCNILNINNISDILINSVLKIEDDIKKYDLKDGAVLSFIFFINNIFFLCHLGDSFIEIFNKSNHIYSSKDHNTNNKHEVDRIKKFTYILNGRVQGIIEPTRCIGDLVFKLNDNHYDNSIIPILEIKTLKLKNIKEKTKIIISTDGLHHTFSRKNFKKYNNILSNLNLTKLKKTLINKNNLKDNIATIFLEVN